MTVNRVLIGSHFWDYNIEGSDMDYMQVIIPTKEDLWNGVMKSTHTVTDDVDIAYKDIRQVFRELKKGSVRTMEALYATPVDVVEENFHLLRVERDFLVTDLRGLLIKQAQNELSSHWKRYQFYRTLDSAKDMKDKITLLKLALIVQSLDSYSNPFIHKLPILKLIRTGQLGLREDALKSIVEASLAIDLSKHGFSFTLIDAIENEIMDDVLW